MTFFKLFYTTDTQNTCLAHRTTLENKNINARKKITEKTRKKTHPGRQTTKNNTEENTKQTGTDIKRRADATRLSAFNTPPKDHSKNMSEIF